MEKLQPIKKSFGNYIKEGYIFAKNKKVSEKELKLLEEVSLIDNYVLILDDIIDNSLLRNGKHCLYRKIGIPSALIVAEEYRNNAINSLIELSKKLGTKDENKINIVKKANEFTNKVFCGEKIGLELKNKHSYSNSLVKKYFKMIDLFTGEHIKCAVEIGFFLANKMPDKKINRQALLLGEIRQIYDDFEDYFPSHHEPFGDFNGENNRLPEIIFKKFGGNRKKVLGYLNKKNYKGARELVLNLKVRKELYAYCKRNLSKINQIKTDFKYKELIVNFEGILTKL